MFQMNKPDKTQEKQLIKWSQENFQKKNSE